MHFMNDSFVNHGEYKAGCAQRLFKKGQIHFACVRVCVCVCVWGEQGHITAECTARQKSS